jgi:hypothetical protein
MIICCIFIDLRFSFGPDKEKGFSLMQAFILLEEAAEEMKHPNPQEIRVVTVRREIALKLLE